MQSVDFPVAVEARFDEDGTITPLALTWGGQRYHIAGTGRHWSEGKRLHYLVMTPSGVRFELCLDVTTLRWRLLYVWERRPIA
jgi:hypothetical protein